MATVSDLDLDDIIKQVVAKVNLDTDTVSTTDDEGILITTLANTGINRWERNNGVLWNELWTTLTDAADGTKTITSGTATYDAPSDMRFAGGYVRLVSGNEEDRYPVVKPHEAQKVGPSSSKKFAYFTGNPQSGFTLHLHPTPDSTIDSWTIKYDYYKKATKLSAGSDQPEMADPFFLVDYVCSELIREEDPTRWQTYRQDAEEKLKEMEVMNMMYPPYQTYQAEDAHFINTGLILGD